MPPHRSHSHKTHTLIRHALRSPALCIQERFTQDRCLMRNGAHVLALLAGWLLLAGCDHDDRDSDVAIFRLRKNELPYPTDIHFHDSTDGTLNIVPTWRGQTLTPIQIEMNTLD